MLAVDAAARELVARIRAGGGPQFLHALTYRVKGHVSVDAAAYRDQGEVDGALESDPLKLAAPRLAALGVAAERIAAVDAEARAEIEAALAAARAARRARAGRGLYRHPGHGSRPMALMNYAQAACQALAEAMRADARVVALGEDVGRGGIFGQYRGLQQEFGAARVIDTPISEATIMGAAVGMALTGLRPVVEMRVVDFALCAIDEIVNQAAKNRYMFGGQGRVPLVARLPIGIWSGSAAQHSQSLEAWFAHIPGLVVVAPATPADNYELLAAAIACGDPVIYMEHKELWGLARRSAAAAHGRLGQGAHGARREPT